MPGQKIHSAAHRKGEGILTAERSLGRKFRTAHHAVRPYINLPADLQPVAHSSQSHHDGGVEVTLWSERGRKFAIAGEVASVRIVHERHVEAVQIAGNTREFVEHEVSVSGIRLPVIVLKHS